jgi:sugar lactone lactonase YvrE
VRRVAAVAALSFIVTAAASAQATMAPINDGPNPYQTIEGWAKLPAGRAWGSTSAVAVDRDGKSIWVAERCGANSCTTSMLPPVLKFDALGTLVKSFGEGMMLTPHGIFVDKDDNIWVVDCACTGGRGGPPPDPAAAPKGHQIFKFSPDGKLLLTMGTAGGAREPGYFFTPNAVLVAPNGTIFVSEGHSSAEGATARVLKFSKDGALIASWGGKKGNGPDDFDQPHALAMDSHGRLFVGDRGNNRIKIFDQNGKLLDTWYQFSRPSGIFIDKDDKIYVTDSESGSVAKARTDWKRGIRIGNVKDGKVTAYIPDPNENATNTSAAEGIAVDAQGNIYGAEVGPKALKRYVTHGSH